MKLEDVKKGMQVRISMGYCFETDHLCGSLHSEMLNLKGSLSKVKSIHENGGITMADGWTWHPGDFTPVSQAKKKKVEKVLFDENLLWIE